VDLPCRGGARGGAPEFVLRCDHPRRPPGPPSSSPGPAAPLTMLLVELNVVLVPPHVVGAARSAAAGATGAPGRPRSLCACRRTLSAAQGEVHPVPLAPSRDAALAHAAAGGAGRACTGGRPRGPLRWDRPLRRWG